ncbi:MAG: prephenate dehydratase [Candidatus Omnitrophota bacterium]|nr:prephenate dehydratase [Candidatus Omnitrophota bacterium]MDZ4242813.1 prephenate dehydratase [Candidatus Omnitrophota bacterium]
MTLQKLRKKIDAIDSHLMALLNERARLSMAIGREKIKSKKGIYAPAREKQVLARIKALNKGPMTVSACEAIYREIMSGSLALEKPLKVACLGTEGAYSYLATRKKFGSQVSIDSCGNIYEVFQKVELRDCDYGVVPIENSTEGAVTDTFDLLVDSDLKICSQVLQKIEHCLISRSPLEKIKVVYSNPNVFGQCRSWLKGHLPKAAQISLSSTTQSVKMVAGKKGAAAIASRQAAEAYGVPVVRQNVNDIPHNTTRFLVIGVEDAAPTGTDRTSILFSIKDRVGALHAMLTPFFRNKINLTKIESRPSKKKAWDYYFFVDFEGHREDKNVKRALGQLEEMCKYLKVLGSYPVLA